MAGTEGGSREVSDKYTERDDLPVDNPGVEPHVERYTDANPKAGNRAYRQVLTLLSLVPVLAIAFVVVYFAVPRDATVEIGPLYICLLYTSDAADE